MDNDGEMNHDFPQCSVENFHAALDLGLLSDNVVEQIQKFHEREEFRDELIQEIRRYAYEGATWAANISCAQYVARELYAIEGLIELSRRRRKK